ncbi:hypothetical protein [Methanobacterium alcaliphilum]|uniref:hypothetical protein n=1 Tax=Methanobacterium alcaliphilum TaxID=392018 RepID=UPI00200A19F8|nr:hypothetical protein [Methanobacterium alcaliphilum]MCK9152429.1 hypothetical protein [Methanobacterium alcaliphilum]
MSYLLCRQCNGYYELKQTESPQDFETCCCGGPLRYIKSISKFYNKNKDYFDDDYDIDTTAIIYNSLKQFKNHQEISSNYTHSNDKYYNDQNEDRTYFNQQDNFNHVSSQFREEIVSSEGFEYFKAVAYEDNYSANIETMVEPTPVELQIDIFETGNNQNPYLEAPQENYELIDETSTIDSNPEYYEDFNFEEAAKSSLINQGYYENVENISHTTFSIKKYFTNNILTILGMGILPISYLLLFGSLTLNIIGSFLIALSIIIAYLPRSNKIEKHEDIKRICSVWTIYAVVFGIMLLSWAMLNLVKLPVIHI